ETSVKRLTRRDLGRPDGDHRHASAWSDAQSRAGLRAIKLGASRGNPRDGGFPAVSLCSSISDFSTTDHGSVYLVIIKLLEMDQAEV
ncbi:MAG: hypothetical protein ACK5HO_10930, partial [Pseudomonadota bacterium]